MRYAQWLMAAMAVLALAPCQTPAEVRLPKIFADNMMLQRNQPIPVWGWAAPGEAVKVVLAGKEASATADADGRWAVKLAALKEGENLELTVAGKNTIAFKNVIVGDIWLCGGQSNMELPLFRCLNFAGDAKVADFPKIRRVKIDRMPPTTPEENVPVSKAWLVCTPQTVGEFTAVGFYFAREISQKTGVPVGLLDDNRGATEIEPWISLDGMDLVPEFKKEALGKRSAIANYQTTQLPKALDEMEHWIAATRAALANGRPFMRAPEMPVNPETFGWGSLYGEMIRPLARFPIKGILWYQGENNGSDGDIYCDKMHALIGGWRQQWNLGDLPFYFVQLANFKDVNDSPAGGDGWAKIRCAQTKALSIPHTGMVVAIDTVPLAEANDIHPKNKYDVGLRLARWALANEYGQNNLEVSGPLFREMKIDGEKIRLSFDHVGAGLMVGRKAGREPAAEAKEDKLKRFAIAGADKKWFWADAVIDGTCVVVSSADVKAPVAVRYAFANNPDGANLYNKDGLPASPFRTDDW